jgi:hypothetical protein
MNNIILSGVLIGSIYVFLTVTNHINLVINKNKSIFLTNCSISSLCGYTIYIIIKKNLFFKKYINNMI